MKETKIQSSSAAVNTFAVPVFEDFLLYNPLQKTAALAEKSTLNILRNILAGEGCVTSLNTLFNTPTTYIPKPPVNGLKPQFLGILPTRDCNLDCLYCGFNASNHKPKTMQLSLAVAAVDWMAKTCVEQNRDSLEVHFFGGEPFVAREVVETVVYRTRQQAEKNDLRPVLETSTNGYFGSEWCQFVTDYFDSVVISFDGRRNIQDRYRPSKGGQGTFDTILHNAQTIARSKVKLCIRICTTNETVSDLVEFCEWLCNTIQPDVINLETLKQTEESASFGLYPPPPMEYAKRCLQAIDVAEKYGVKAVCAAASLDNIQHSFCPVGKDVLIVSPSGRVSGCYLLSEEWREKGMDMDIGFLDSECNLQLDHTSIERVRSYSSVPLRCTRCISRYHCSGGCHVSQSPPGCEDGFNDFCIHTRIMTVMNILKYLGSHETVDRLFGDEKSLSKLAFQKSDLLCDILQEEVG